MTPFQEKLLNTLSYGIFGKGEFGAFLEERIKALLPGADVRTFDPYMPSSHSEEEVVDSDIILLATPPLEIEAIVRSVAPRMKLGAIIGDVCSVKMHTAEIMRKFVPKHVHYVLTHPLFGPQSFVDNGSSLKGLELAYCGGRLTPAAASITTSVLGGLGLRVVHMTPEEHDRGPSIEQLVTMYQGLVMKRAGFELNKHKLHTRSAQHYFRAMYIVQNDEELFKQIAQLNPFWSDAKRRLEAAYHDVFVQNGH